MTLIDALAALQEGAVPTNEQTIAFIDRIQDNLPGRDGLSKPGSKLVRNGSSVLDAIHALITERNQKEEIQEFLWRTQGTAKSLRKDGLKLKFGGEQTAKKHKEKKEQKKVKEKAKSTAATVKDDGIQGRLMSLSKIRSVTHADALRQPANASAAWCVCCSFSPN